MSKKLGASFEGGQFNTLGQSGTTSALKKVNKPEITVQGTGTDISKVEVMDSKTKKKLITQQVTIALIKVSEIKDNPERKQYYWNTFHCQSRITSANGRTYGKYCRNLYCTTCSGIRKAELINKYLVHISAWPEPYFVTITAKSVSAKSLQKRIIQMIDRFQRIKNKLRKQYQRGKGIKFYGIKSLECNFNPIKRTYNPHFHFIFPNKECAMLFRKEWLNKLGWKFASPKAQHFRKVKDTEHDMIETIKYGSKIFTDPEGNDKNRKAVTPFVYASALDNIIWALKGHRLFERFGFDLPKQPKQKIEPQQLIDYKEWRFDPKAGNWINSETNELISGYSLPPELKQLLAYNVNLELE